MEYVIKHWRDAVEILILWVALYQSYRLFRATQGARVLVGLVALIVSVILISILLELKVIEWMLTRAGVAILFAMLVVFQPELRNALARLGSSRLFSFINLNKSQKIEFIETFSDTVVNLSKKRIGALFAFERDISLEEQIETGVAIRSQFSQELALTIFYPGTALHDGGMVISKNRIAAAGCIFPVSQKELADRALGLRHRASIGVTEETDAVAVVVSEETGGISLCVDGRLERGLKPDEFRERLREVFLMTPNEEPEQDEEDEREQLASDDRVADPSDRDLVSD